MAINKGKRIGMMTSARIVLPGGRVRLPRAPSAQAQRPRRTPRSKAAFVVRDVARRRAQREITLSRMKISADQSAQFTGVTLNRAGDPIFRARIRQCLQRLISTAL